MLTLPSSVRIYVAAESVDLRRGFDGLAAATRSLIGADPLAETPQGVTEREMRRGGYYQ